MGDPRLESSQDNSIEEGRAVPTVQKTLQWTTGEHSTGSDPSSEHPSWSAPGCSGDVSEPPFLHLKTGHNKRYFSGLLQGFAEGLLVKLLVGNLVCKRCSVNAGCNRVVIANNREAT